MMILSVSSRGHLKVQPLIRSICTVVTVGMFQRDAAKLAVALTGVAVSEIEQRAGRVDRQVDHRTDADIRKIHVAPVIVRL